MFKFVRHGLILMGLLGTLVLINGQISALNHLKTEGLFVLLKLAPVDPRAFMQGDYMALNYDDSVLPDWDADGRADGMAVLSVDENNVATFVRLDDGVPISPSEVQIKFARTFRGEATYGGERFFFQEGMAGDFEDAAYGVFRLSPDGRALLVGLAGEDFRTITPQSTP